MAALQLHLTPSCIIQLSLKIAFFKLTIDDSTAVAPHAILYHLTKLKNSFFKLTIDDSTAVAPHAILYYLTKLKNSFFKITIDDSTAVAPHAILYHLTKLKNSFLKVTIDGRASACNNNIFISTPMSVEKIKNLSWFCNSFVMENLTIHVPWKSNVAGQI